MAEGTGANLGRATAKIGLDASGMVAQAKVAAQSAKQISRAFADAAKETQNQQRITLAQIQQTTTVLRAQQAQITAVSRAEASKRMATARAEASERAQQARATANAQIEAERRATAQFRSELRQREQASRSSGRGSMPSMMGGLQSLAGGFGIGLGVAGAVQAGRAVVEATQTATAYERQHLAAVKLAGSQDKLNSLLAAYAQATGNAVDDATALSDVTNLQAIGYGKSAQQLERFVRTARGVAIARGRPQDEMIQEVSLTIANQSSRRFDQIGLGIAEVNDRITELRANNRGLTREAAFEEAVLSKLIEKYGALTTSAEGQATGTEKLTKAWANARLEIGKMASPVVGGIGGGLAKAIDAEIARWHNWQTVIEQVGRAIGMIAPPSSIGSRTTIGRVTPQASGSGSFTEDQTAAMRAHFSAVKDIERSANEQRQSETEQYESQRTRTIANYEQSIAREAQDFALSRQRQAEQLARQIADIQEDAARREAKAAQDLADSIAKMQQDSARQTARWERDLSKSIADARNDSAERVADSERDHNERITDAREDSNERLAEQQTELDERLADERANSLTRLADMERDYQKNRERAERAHKDTILDAAARLDARAIWQEQRNFEREQTDAASEHNEAISKERARLADFEREAQEAHAKAIAKEQERLAEFEQEESVSFAKRLKEERENLADRIAQERAAHAQRIADAREALELQIADQIAGHEKQLEEARLADAQRIADMQAADALRQQQENEDRNTRLGRMATDHNNQLAEMDRTHSERLAQISRHAAAERAKQDEEFMAQLADLGIRIDGWSAEQDRLTDEAIESFKKWLKAVEKGLKSPTDIQEEKSAQWQKLQKERAAVMTQLNNTPRSNTAEYARLIKELNRIDTELAALGGGASTSGFGALAQQAASATTPQAGTARYSFPTPVSRAATGTGGNSSSVTIASGAVVVYGAMGQNEERIGEIVEQRLLNVIRTAKGGTR